MNLIKAEISRFTSRRFIQIMLVVLLVAFGLTIFTVIASSESATPEMWEQARASAAQEKEYLTREYNNCISAVTDIRHCQQLNPARVVPEDYLYGVFHFGRQIKPLLYFLGAFLSLFGYLVMASFIGSELHSGGMTNLLLWRPQRDTVLGSKLGVGLGMIGAISVMFTAIYIATFWGIATVTGYSGGVTSYFWSEIAIVAMRAIGMALVASAIAFAVATIGRHTAAALGALIGYVIVWEGGARLMMEIVDVEGASDPYFLSTYVAAWFAGRYEYYDEIYFDFGFSGYTHTIHWWHSGILFLVTAAAACAVAFVTFRRRDLM